MNRFILLILLAAVSCAAPEDNVYLTLVPPGVMTDKIDLDIRTGIVNSMDCEKDLSVSVTLMRFPIRRLCIKRICP